MVGAAAVGTVGAAVGAIVAVVSLHGQLTESRNQIAELRAEAKEDRDRYAEERAAEREERHYRVSPRVFLRIADTELVALPQLPLSRARAWLDVLQLKLNVLQFKLDGDRHIYDITVSLHSDHCSTWVGDVHPGSGVGPERLTREFRKQAAEVPGVVGYVYAYYEVPQVAHDGKLRLTYYDVLHGHWEWVQRVRLSPDEPLAALGIPSHSFLGGR